MEALGATIVVHGQTQDDAEAHAQQLATEQELTYISAFDDPAIIAGQGTIGLEILEECPAVATLVAPLSGGGLLGGIALALKSADPTIQIVGISQVIEPAMYRSIVAGHPVAVVEEPSLADSLLGGIGLENRYTFTLIRDWVDEISLLSESEIAAGMLHALQTERQLLEGGGSVGIGALLANKLQPVKSGEADGPLVIIASGGNVELAKLLSIAANAGSLQQR